VLRLVALPVCHVELLLHHPPLVKAYAADLFAANAWQMIAGWRIPPRALPDVHSAPLALPAL